MAKRGEAEGAQTGIGKKKAREKLDRRRMKKENKEELSSIRGVTREEFLRQDGVERSSDSIF